jgi:hypothetical protein
LRLLSDAESLAHHKLEVGVYGLIGGIQFGFDTNDLFISSNQRGCHCVSKVSNSKQQIVFLVKELESLQASITVNFNFPGLLDRLWHHEVFHRLVTLLLSALAIARNKVVSTTITTTVLNSCKIEVFSSLFDELPQHEIARKLNFLVLVVRRALFVGKLDVFQV